MPTRAVASKFKVELAIFGGRFCNQKGLTGQLGSIHGKFSTDWRAARSEFASLPLEKRVMVVHIYHKAICFLPDQASRMHSISRTGCISR